MALNIPAAVTTLTTITKTWSDAIRESLLWLATDAPTCRVFHSANQSCTNGTLTTLLFDSERYDPAGCHSTTTNTERITVPTGAGGKWAFGATVSFAANATGQRQVRILLNGSTVLAEDIRDAAAGGEVTSITVSGQYALSAGDYLTVVARQTSGGALNVSAASAYSPEFWAEWRRT